MQDFLTAASVTCHLEMPYPEKCIRRFCLSGVFIMNEKFFDLKKEKQDRMINGALKVFALNGYKHASTDDIVAEAKISKGLLFHYFGSKIGLYEFLFDYASHFAVVELQSGVKTGETDYFRIQRQIASSETALQKQYPYITMFLDSVLRETSEEALGAVADSRGMVSDCYRNLLANADYRAIGCGSADSEDAQMLSRLIDYTKQGLLRSRLEDMNFSPDDLEKETDAYLDYLERLTKK